MEEIQDFFLCENCSSKDFKLVYNFSIRFHKVNFSDELIYDRLAEEIYRCIKCDKTYSRKQVEDGLTEFKKKRKEKAI
jgi:DNA-directed RNA polymerase subunit RPC12/RpoP